MVPVPRVTNVSTSTRLRPRDAAALPRRQALEQALRAPVVSLGSVSSSSKDVAIGGGIAISSTQASQVQLRLPRQVGRGQKVMGSSKGSKGSKNSKGSQGSKNSKGSGRKKPSGGIPAAVCLLSALVAGSATQADAFSLRKEWTDQITNCTYPYSLALPAVNFSSEVDYINIPVSDPNARFTPVSPTSRRHRGEKPLDFVPEVRADSTREAQMSAKTLKASISTKDDIPACRWECDSEIGCNHALHSEGS